MMRRAQRLLDGEDEERLAGRGAGLRGRRFHCWDGRAPRAARRARGQAAGAAPRPATPAASRSSRAARGATACAAARSAAATPRCSGAGARPAPRGKGGGTVALGLLHGQATQREQMQARDQRERIDVQGRAALGQARWYAGGGTGAVDRHGAGTMG